MYFKNTIMFDIVMIFFSYSVPSETLGSDGKQNTALSLKDQFLQIILSSQQLSLFLCGVGKTPSSAYI